jgi:predicted PurR-regulated permease PerM
MNLTSISIIKKLLVIFLTILALYYAKDFLIPLAIAAVIATLFLPFCKWMESKKIVRGIATTICIIALLLFMGSILTLLIWQISLLTTDFELLKLRAIDTSDHIQEYIFNQFGITAEKQSQIIKAQQTSVTKLIPGILGSLTSNFASLILTLVYIFCLIYYRGHIKQFLLKLSVTSQRHETEKVIYKVAQVSQQYLFGLSKMIFLLWIMYGIGFSIIGVKNAIFFAILCGLLEIVPFIGNITGTLITVLVAAVQGASPAMILGIIGTYGLVQFIQGWVLEPIIVGSQVKINPMFTIIALVIGELIWGIPGIFLAIPLIAMFKIICDHIEPLKPYGFLISEIETSKVKISFTKKILKWYKNKISN